MCGTPKPWNCIKEGDIDLTYRMSPYGVRIAYGNKYVYLGSDELIVAAYDAIKRKFNKQQE